MQLPPAVRRLRRIRQARVADVPNPFGPQSPLQRARVLSPIARSACGSIPNASLSPPRDKSSANIAAFLPASHQRKSTTTVFDWRQLSGGHSTQAGKPCVTARPSPNCCRPWPGLTTADAQDAGWRPPRWSRLLSSAVLQHDEQAVLAAVELALEAGAPTKTPYSERAAPIDRRASRLTHQL